ncbi:unnamed protein product [Caenorhabditis bovis]|uniref:Secreted protein n=1 Tax=Caenorhabditis bovis TaxID=2654633 RepID=A0A8S1EHS7_9PELO|nr:unnamed protein product [Caenorhabditis bovis]
MSVNRTLAFLAFITIAMWIMPVHAIQCHLYHKIWEDGHVLRINPDVCHSSSKYCVRATYSDPDPRKKNGFSMGCDKVDCAGIEGGKSHWFEKEKGMMCRKSRDYGKHGLAIKVFVI